MNLFQQFAPLIASGVTVHLKLSASGENMQLDLIPVAKENKAGISLTPKALVATAAELDEKLPRFLETYLASQIRISDLIDESQKELQAAEEAARGAAQAAKAAAVKSPGKGASGVRPTTASPVRKDRNLTDGLMDEDDGDGLGDLSDTTPSTNAAEVPPGAVLGDGHGVQASATAATGELSPSLF